MKNCINRAAVPALLLCVAAGLPPGDAAAAERPLAGVRDFTVMIEHLDEDSAACGITGEALAEAIESETAGAPRGAGGKGVTLYLRVSTLPKDGNCFSSVDIEAYYFGVLGRSDRRAGAEAKVELWSNGTILVTRRGEHAPEVGAVIRQLVRGFMQDWRRDNS